MKEYVFQVKDWHVYAVMLTTLFYLVASILEVVITIKKKKLNKEVRRWIDLSQDIEHAVKKPKE